MKVSDFTRMMREELTPRYGYDEARAIIGLIYRSLKGWDAIDLIMHETDEVSEYIQGKAREILDRLQKDEPIQYIVGEAHFYGMDLKVDRSVLIPRPETAEMVDMIVDKWKDCKDLRVLDIGTGSGAIAIALSRNLPFSEVTAIDISEDALKIARENAENLKAKIDFRREDVFDFMPEAGSFDIIVSNPPYIDESEKSDMERNVLDYEPHTALFVPDDNPLIFYSRISTIASEALTPGGGLYFEINPRHCEELKGLLRKDGFEDVEAVKDVHGKERFVIARKKSEEL